MEPTNLLLGLSNYGPVVVSVLIAFVAACAALDLALAGCVATAYGLARAARPGIHIGRHSSPKDSGVSRRSH